MTQSKNVNLAQRLQAGLKDQLDPDLIAASFSADLSFEIQGDDGVLPWIGRKTGRQALVEFIRDMRVMTEPVSFHVEDILASDSRTAIVGSLETRIIETGKITTSQFAIILTIEHETVRRFQMSWRHGNLTNVRSRLTI